MKKKKPKVHKNIKYQSEIKLLGDQAIEEKR